MSQYITALRYNKTEAKFKSHYINKSFLMQFSINDNDVSAGKNNRKRHSIHLCRYGLRFRTKTLMRQPLAKVLDTLFRILASKAYRWSFACDFPSTVY